LQASLRLLRPRTQPDADRRAWSALRWPAREERRYGRYVTHRADRA